MAGEERSSKSSKDYIKMNKWTWRRWLKEKIERNKWEDTSIIGGASLEKRGGKTNQYKVGENSMAEIGKNMSKKSENRYRKKINGILYQFMDKWNENDKMNG